MALVDYIERQVRKERAELLAGRLVAELRRIAQTVNAELKNMSEDERSEFLASLAEKLGGDTEADKIIKKLFEVLDYVLRR
ncbi:MAG: hypothetical protein J7K15_10340 [Deltaproteobacteria bacterium]|nr:hypothetical protein [Deltaproteobacteria bacterium]